ncbi:2-dehydro-3-deoxygalactonokinase [Thalassobius sp. S69A]|uniref:2-dehydro-3-deoxygalactonokinase n=1 Tax=unclassified Thalassovita TaxID=2619711 RepID=UPI003C7BDC01
MSDWIGIIEDQTGARGWRFGSDSITPASGLSTDAVLAQLGNAEVFVITPARATQKVPAKLLPEGAFLDMTDGASRLAAPLRLQLLGFQDEHPDWDGVVLLLTETHSYWCFLSARELVGFQAFLTPRLIAALDVPAQADADAIADTLSRPERLAAHLAASESQPDAQTGHLIGAEMGAARAWWLGQQVTVIGPAILAQSYAAGLSAQGVPCTHHDDPSARGLYVLRSAHT